MPYCPNCAAQVLADDRFCSACGKAITPNPRVPTEASKTPAPVGEDAATTETATTPTTDTGKRPLRKIGYGCLTALALVIALAFGLASWGTNDAKAAARGHLDLIKNGQVALAYQQTSPDLQALLPLEQYQALIGARPRLKSIERISFPIFERENDVANLTARVRFADGLTSDVPMRLRKEAGQWRLIAIDLGQVPVDDAPAAAAPPPADPTPRQQSPAATALPPANPTPRQQPPVATPVRRPDPTLAQAPAEALTAARSYINLITADEVELSYRRTSPDFQAAAPLQGYLAIFRERPVLREVAKVDFTQTAQDASDTLIIRANLETADGRTFAVPLRLREESGQWRVLAADWSGVPTARQAAAANPKPRQPVAAPGRTATTTASRGERSVGTVIIGAGRNQDGTLVRPGLPVPSRAERISADIQLVNHTAGDRVRVWIERVDGSARTEAIESAIDGQGTGYMPFELKLGSEGIPVGAYRLMVRLGDDQKFATAFEVR